MRDFRRSDGRIPVLRKNSMDEKLGDPAEITPVSGEPPLRGEVVYCQRLDNDRFSVDVKIRESRIPWSILRRFDGTRIS